MFKQFLDKIPGADVFMVASFLVFFVFFLVVTLSLLFTDKAHMDEMSKQPLHS